MKAQIWKRAGPQVRDGVGNPRRSAHPAHRRLPTRCSPARSLSPFFSRNPSPPATKRRRPHSIAPLQVHDLVLSDPDSPSRSRRANCDVRARVRAAGRAVRGFRVLGKGSYFARFWPGLRGHIFRFKFRKMLALANLFAAMDLCGLTLQPLRMNLYPRRLTVAMCRYGKRT